VAKKPFSELPFASLLVYSPRGQTDVSVRSRGVRDRVKAGRPATIDQAVKRIRETLAPSNFESFLGPEVPLVPVPGSSPRVAGGLWVPERICEALVGAGLGSEVAQLLERTEPVPKSAFSLPGERPDVDRHISTISAARELRAFGNITLIDDFVTRGRTFFAAASVLHEAYPEATIRAVALVRTMGLVPDIPRILEPCAGRIYLLPSGNDVDREP